MCWQGKHLSSDKLLGRYNLISRMNESVSTLFMKRVSSILEKQDKVNLNED